jgi:nitrite reductase/ring-hydroxylating ferredoxin subunit
MLFRGTVLARPNAFDDHCTHESGRQSSGLLSGTAIMCQSNA